MTLEADVERAAASVLGADAASVGRLTHGDINRVFRVSAGGRDFVLKVFAFPGWPEAGKLPWVESKLAARGVPRARLLHYTRGAEFFPHGFSLSERLPGANCKQAIRDGRLSPFDYLERAGAFLRAVHDIEPPRFGYLADGQGTADDYVEWIVNSELKDRADELADAPGVGRDACARAAVHVEKILRRFERRFRPALVHADATPKNAILDDDRVTLIDWDEAFAGPWLWDYTHLSYWYSYMHPRGGPVPDDAASARAAFFRGYGASEFDDEELDALEGAMHLVEVLGVLAFQFRRDVEEFSRARSILARFLEHPRA